MAIISVAALTIKPGRFEDFLKQQRMSEALLKNAGAQNLRLMVGLVAGEASGSAVATFEAEDFKAYGEVLHNFFTGGGAEVMAAIGAEDSPIASWQASIYVDVPH